MTAESGQTLFSRFRTFVRGGTFRSRLVAVFSFFLLMIVVQFLVFLVSLLFTIRAGTMTQVLAVLGRNFEGMHAEELVYGFSKNRANSARAYELIRQSRSIFEERLDFAAELQPSFNLMNLRNLLERHEHTFDEYVILVDQLEAFDSEARRLSGDLLTIADAMREEEAGLSDELHAIIRLVALSAWHEQESAERTMNENLQSIIAFGKSVRETALKPADKLEGYRLAATGNRYLDTFHRYRLNLEHLKSKELELHQSFFALRDACLAAEEVVKQRLLSFQWWALVILVAFFVLSVGTAAFATIFFSESLSRPLTRLLDATAAIRAGEYGRLVEIDSSDEFGELGRQFNTMADELKTSREKILLHQRTLEQNILDRTRQVRLSEALLRQIIDLVPHFIYAKDEDGRYFLVNRAFAEVCRRSVEEMIGLTYADLGGFEDEIERVNNEDREVIRSNRPMSISDYRTFVRDGPRRFLQTNKIPFQSEDGGKRSLLGVSIDLTEITEQKNLAEALKDEAIRARQAADAANQSKSLFLANMSHEIRTPLNAIIGYSQLLSRNAGLNETQIAYLTTIMNSGSHLLSLIDNILEISRIEAGHLEYRPAPFDLRLLLDSVKTMFAARAEMHGVRMEFVTDATIPRLLVTDEGKLRQILVNIVGNAVKFTEKGHITTTASYREGTLQIEVEDSGTGIAPEELALVFEKFEQTSSGRRVGSGTGLGMALSLRFARFLKGDITVESRPCEGTTFRLTLPVDLPREGVLASDVAPARRVRGIAPGSRRMTVLVADDLESNRSVLTTLLNLVGFGVGEAVDGRDAVEKFEKLLPDAVLMDLKMPEMSGIEALRQIRASERGRQVPVLIITAQGVDENRREALLAGATGFICKPFREDDLLRELGTCLGVSYVYEDASAGGRREKESAGAFVDLSSLSHEFIRELRRAIQRGERKGCLELLNTLPERDAAIGERLRELVNAYEYDRLLEVLKIPGEDGGST
ncbi:MAG TPA: ATP-binding protein [Candidatus Ozemobacteraceae bacterium]|nr:ATP-binding protein [Candidatus Ozemobacteraceae bacterium]HQG27475.1 ATP-binding protein [Candidatus Ozemobacteraceae bacterium]